MHLKSQNIKLGTEPGIGGFTMAEIDESSIIGNGDDVFWMFYVIDRITKEAREVFSVFIII